MASQSGSTNWSDWFMDPRGFRYRVRYGLSGVEEYEYDYRDQDEDNIDLQAQRCTTASSSEMKNPTSPNARPADTSQQKSSFSTAVEEGLVPLRTTETIYGYDAAHGSSLQRSDLQWTRGGNVHSRLKVPPVWSAGLQQSIGEPDNRKSTLPNRSKGEPSEDHLSGSIPKHEYAEDKKDEPIRTRRPFHGQVGRVFSVSCGEPAGDFPHRRRFVVVGGSYAKALCSPISTYSGQACLKPDLRNVYKHAIIHTSIIPPSELWYEAADEKIIRENLTMSPIRVMSEQPGAKGDLGQCSRLNFSKLYIVELSIPVLNIGMVCPTMLETLIRYAGQARDWPALKPTASRSPNLSNHNQGSKEQASTEFTKVASTSWNNVSEAHNIDSKTTAASVLPDDIGSTDQLEYYHRPSKEHSLLTTESRLSAISNYLADDLSVMQLAETLMGKRDYSESTPLELLDSELKVSASTNDDRRKLLSQIGVALNERNEFVNKDPIVKDMAMHGSYQPSRRRSSRSEDGSISSLVSSHLNDSIFSASVNGRSSSTASSYTSSYELHSAPLLAFFSEDIALKQIFQGALYSISPDKFEKILQTCLRQFARHLRIEAQNSAAPPARLSDLVGASKVVQQLSRYTACCITRRFQAEHEQQKAIHNTLEYKKLVETEHLLAEVVSGELMVEQDEFDEEDGDDDYDDDELKNEMKDLTFTLEEVIRRTNAFQSFQENFKLFLSPNIYKRALFNTWPITQLQATIVTLEYNLEWELPYFLHSDQGEPKDFRRLITLTGSAEGAQALTCEDYIMTTWSNIGPLLLKAVDALLDTYESAEVHDYTSESWYSIELYCKSEDVISGPSRLHVVAKMCHFLHLELLSALSWLCVTFRHSPFEDVRYSNVSIKTPAKPKAQTNLPLRCNEASKTILISLKDLEQCSHAACWHSLFPYGVMASGFPIAHRLEGKGLEISFADMALVSRCLGFVSYEAGLIAHGLTSVLVPIQELAEDDALQWHFEDKAKQDSGRIFRISQTLRKCKIREWYQELSPERLIRRRCFLGWARKANVVIGTSGYQDKARNFERSGASKSPKIYSRKAIAFSFSMSAMSYVTIQGTRESTQVGMKSSVTQSHMKDLLATIHTSHKRLVLLYDNATKIAYYVPQASVVLHLAHTFVSSLGYTLLDGDQPLDIVENTSIFAKVDPDGATAACLALRACMKLKVDRRDGDKPKGFADIIEKTWHNLNNIETHLDTADTDFQLAGVVAPKYLHGIELEDAANWEQNMSIRQVQVDQAWAHLASETAIVLFGKNFKEPIVAECPNLCETWAKVPEEQNYLAAMGIAVKTLLEGQLDGLADRLDWLDQKELVQYHEHTRLKAVQHVQKLRSLKKSHSNAATRQSIETQLQSCLVFGNEKNVKTCHEKPKSAELSSMGNNLIEVSEQAVAFTRVPSSASASSVSTSSGTNKSISSISNSSGEEGSSTHLSQILPKLMCSMPKVSENSSEIATTVKIESTCKEGSRSSRDLSLSGLSISNLETEKAETTAPLRLLSELKNEEKLGSGKNSRGKRKQVATWIRGGQQAGSGWK